MSAKIRRSQLTGRWIHSHEEDSEHEIVYRPSSYAFPPSRGRSGFDLRADGTVVRIAPGPADVPEESTGEWRLEADDLILEPRGGESRRALHIVSASSDRLVVRRST